MAPPRDIPPGDMLDGIEAAGTPAARPGIPGLLWRWRYELGGGATVMASALAIDLTAGFTCLIAVAAAAAVSTVAAIWWPPSRRKIVARIMCVVVQHRVRTACVNAWVQTRTGKLPVIVWTVPRPFGERMLLLCRAGITPADLIAAREVLRVACWAADVRVIPDARHPHLVTLDIIRVPYPDDAVTPDWPRRMVDGPDDAEAEPPLLDPGAARRHRYPAWAGAGSHASPGL
jgi:hypothetical protein